MREEKILVSRDKTMLNKAVIVDGIPGCGKTLVSSIISSFKKVELYKFCYELEYYCLLNFFNQMDLNTSSKMVRLKFDQLIYDVMMGREVNFRFNDQSSVFQTANRFRYFKRIFQEGDQSIPNKIIHDKPILNIATHLMSGFNEPILRALKEKVIFLTMHRDPLFMIEQNIFNVSELYGTNRDFQLYFERNKEHLPFYTLGWEDKFLSSPPKERAIFFLEWARKQLIKNKNINKSFKNYYEFTFESFVLNPFKHMNKMKDLIGTSFSSSTNSICKREKVPRKIISDGRNIEIYRRIGWKKMDTDDLNKEYEILKNRAYSEISSEAKKSLDWLIEDYKFLKKELNEN